MTPESTAEDIDGSQRKNCPQTSAEGNTLRHGEFLSRKATQPPLKSRWNLGIHGTPRRGCPSWRHRWKGRENHGDGWERGSARQGLLCALSSKETVSEEEPWIFPSCPACVLCFPLQHRCSPLFSKPAWGTQGIFWFTGKP